MPDSTQDPQHPPGKDHLEAALEATCETLVALQLISESARDDDGVKSQARGAIGALRRAISELRSERAERASALAFGFVVGNRQP